MNFIFINRLYFITGEIACTCKKLISNETGVYCKFKHLLYFAVIIIAATNNTHQRSIDDFFPNNTLTDNKRRHVFNVVRASKTNTSS